MYICGISETDITPSMGMEIPGYFARRLAAGVLDPLSALTAYFENDGDRAVLISCDAIGVPLSVCDRARHRIAEALSMTPDAVLICATHSHTGGPVEHFGSFCQENNPYLAFLEERIVDVSLMVDTAAQVTAEASGVVFAGEEDVFFAAQGLGGDNGVGAAILASMR